ncbi:MAG: ATP-binding cassette domain-containing protein [Desulfobacteraceae bacterium]|nr:ATP-binding cassette domain-containing protein [Desulfobacteraceae bacterium]
MMKDAAFSEGEQQRINLARGFAAPWAILLLDEPTASLDPGTRNIAMDLIREAVQAGTCVIAVFLTPPDPKEIPGRIIDLSQTA